MGHVHKCSKIKRMLNFRKSSYSFKQKIVHLFKRYGRKTGRTEQANFDFRREYSEEKALLSSRCSSTRSSNSSNSSSKLTDNLSASSGFKKEKMFLYVLPFVILIIVLL